jgi:hypothetical protein
MKLTDLQPEWEYDNSYMSFNCPTCPRDASKSRFGNCLIIIPTKVTEHQSHPWGWNGETDFEKCTLTPSIWHHCKTDPHFFIREGAIQFA